MPATKTGEILTTPTDTLFKFVSMKKELFSPLACQDIYKEEFARNVFMMKKLEDADGGEKFMREFIRFWEIKDIRSIPQPAELLLNRSAIEKTKLYRESGVYVFTRSHPERFLLYCGSAIDLDQRMNQRLQPSGSRHYFHEAEHLVFFLTENYRECEKYLIFALKPVYNGDTFYNYDPPPGLPRELEKVLGCHIYHII